MYIFGPLLIKNTKTCKKDCKLDCSLWLPFCSE